MSDKDNFTIYGGTYLNGLGIATIIVTVDEKAIPLAYSEYFAFLENDHLIYDEFKLEFDTSGVPESIADIDLSIIARDALCEAEQRLSRKLRKLYKDYLPNHSLSKLIDLVPSDEGAIIRLIMRNKFPDKIDRVIQVSRSEKLRSCLNKYRGLPKVVYRDSL